MIYIIVSLLKLLSALVGPVLTSQCIDQNTELLFRSRCLFTQECSMSNWTRVSVSIAVAVFVFIYGPCKA